MTKKSFRSRGENFVFWVTLLTIFLAAWLLFEVSLVLVVLLFIWQIAMVFAAERQHLGNSLLVSEDQFPELYELAKATALKLKIRRVPRVFVQQSPELNAFALGVFRPYSIVFTSALIEAFSADELEFVMAHEMGHILLGHTRYLTLLGAVGSSTPALGMFTSVWNRKTEFSSDRVGVYVSMKIKPILSALVKLAVGSNLSQYVDVTGLIKQLNYQESQWLSGAGQWFASHPYLLHRIEEVVSVYHEIQTKKDLE